ncbi:MAG: hypothetical protein IH945_06430 [Armatimonadetes bacterium]|nr:hypothetical protein [Armatimonadota bacterium]
MVVLVAFDYQDERARTRDDERLKVVLAQGIQHENQSWERYPTSLPSAFVDAADLLFEHGLEDPTGGEYREIAVTVPSSLKNEEKQIKTNGWVFTDQTTGLLYAVCWDGMRYEVDWVGRKTEISRDLVPPKQPEQPLIIVGFMRAPVEYPTFSPHSRVGAALLYRLKDEYNAKRALPTESYERGISIWRSIISSYVTMRFYRGVGEFLSGDDGAALAILDPLIGLVKKAEADYESFPEHIRRDTSLSGAFPRNLERLRDDIADRIENPRTVVRALDEIEALPGDERVLQCVINMQEISREMFLQRSLPFPTDITPEQIAEIRTEQLAKIRALQTRYDSYYSLVSSLGDDAVPLLLNLAREDKYAARYVSNYMGMGNSWRRDTRARPIPFASDLAGSLARTVIRPLYAGDLVPSREKYDLWEAFWNRYKGVPFSERDWLILGEEDRAPRAWIEVLGRLTSTHKDFNERVPTLSRLDELTPEAVSETLSTVERRLADYVATESPDYDLVCKAARAAYRLDPAGARTILRIPIDYYLGLLDEKRWPDAVFREELTQEMTIYLLQIGDPNIATDYTKILEGRYSRGSGLRLEKEDLPLVLYPEKPEFESTLVRKFDEKMQRVVEGKSYLYGNPDEIAPFLASESLRPKVVELLEATASAGDAKAEAMARSDKPNREGLYDIMFRYRHGNEGGFSGQNVQVTKEDLRYIGTEQTLRVMDWVAYSLSRAKFGPEFQLFWEVERRDQVIAEYKSLVMTKKFDVLKHPEYTFRNWWWISREPVSLYRK